MRQNEPLPVAVERVLAADRVEHEPASGRERLQEQMYLGIVAQRLEMPHALDPFRDRLAVEDVTGVKGDGPVKAVFDQTLDHLALHLSHQTQLNLFLSLVPGNTELGILLLQQLQLWQHLYGIDARGRHHPVAHHRLKLGRRCVRCGAQALTRADIGQARRGHHLSGKDALHRVKFGAGIQAQLGDLLLPLLSVRAAIAQRLPCRQLAAQQLEKAQPRPLWVVGKLEHPRGESFLSLAHRRKSVDGLEQLLHAVKPQPRAEEAGEQRPARDQAGQLLVRRLAAGEDPVHHRLVAEGDLFPEGLVPPGKIQAALVQARLQFRQQLLTRPHREIHFCHEHKAGHTVSLQKPPECLSMGLHAVKTADDEHRAVEHAERPLRFRGKVHMPRRVHQRDGVLWQFDNGLLGEDRNAPLTLQAVGVEKAVAVIDAPQLPQPSGEVEHRLGKRGLPRVYMGQQADANILFWERRGVAHGNTPFYSSPYGQPIRLPRS